MNVCTLQHCAAADAVWFMRAQLRLPQLMCTGVCMEGCCDAAMSYFVAQLT